MKITIESTSKIVLISQRTEVLFINPSVAVESAMEARVWEGVTEGGVKVIALIIRIAVKNGQDVSQFEAELKEQRAPSMDAVQAYLPRMIL